MLRAAYAEVHEMRNLMGTGPLHRRTSIESMSGKEEKWEDKVDALAFTLMDCHYRQGCTFSSFENRDWTNLQGWLHNKLLVNINNKTFSWQILQIKN